ncbi:Na+/H+ antiporter NhaA [Mucilaginibacter sp. UR6-1]|uniref:Na+/H+ antiporter NhaA n=1 Tax=Mucilaginibacter sp. UR6-1 TaxID=1435643 RepID=UPI001E3BA4B2|nr:Na+/H+ antiporter NhaA [Mucilaginibacter sp. UR6-1]MCC8410373.1 Na+/H+ antiporter NhaA [Mucilaginibacter sp. UR6-1]
MAKFRRLKKAVEFIEHPSAGGILLLSCVVLSLVLANSPVNDAFAGLLGTRVAGDALGPEFTVASFINDALMAIFFLMAGLEIKREMVEGELSEVKKAALPVLSAIGGMLFPALIYFIFNYNASSTSAGWGIPMATDIAFAIAILNVLRKFIPVGAKVFLTALAIVDDLGAIVVIALFYTHGLEINYLFYALAFFALALVFNYFDLKNAWFYLVPGMFMWYFIHHSGIHATVAGVLTAFAVPVKTKSGYSPLTEMEHKLSVPVNFIILPLFALANTNITYEPGMLGSLLTPLGLGIIFGLVVGKPLGIFLMTFAAVKTKLSKLPEGINWAHLLGIGTLAGIGFTMSIFISLLSFSEPGLQSSAKFAILTASVVAALAGFVGLRAYSKRVG